MSTFQTPANWNVTSTSTVFQTNSSDWSALVTSYGSTTSRNTITTLFVGLNFSLAVAGAQYLKDRARRSVSQGKIVPIRHLTSWLALSDVVKYTWSSRRLPGGGFGMLMAFTGIIGVLHQFLTNTFVTPALVPTRCILDYGTVSDGSVFSWLPNAEDDGADLVYQSQLATIRNGGTQGVFGKLFAANEVQMFRPEENDIHGAWSCVNIKNGTVPWTGPPVMEGPPAGITPVNLQLYLNTTAYMYRSGPKVYQGSQVGNLTNGFFVWSIPSKKDFSSARVSILRVSGTPHATDFDCALTLDQPAPPLEVQEVLETWMGKAYGYQRILQTVEDSALWLELIMNAITTLSLFNDNINPYNLEPAGEIGCVVEGTRISFILVAILALVALLTLAVLVATRSLAVASLWQPRKNSPDLLPFGLADWQLAAYRQSNIQSGLGLRDLQVLVVRNRDKDDTIYIEPALQTYAKVPSATESEINP